MNNTKGVLIPLVFIVSIIGFLAGVMLQISFEPTEEAYADAKLGKFLVKISIVAFIFALLFVKINRGKK